ncbi:chemotaxis protein CheR [Marinitoga sp. 1135]|uniref:protein-glutamate O-methyltransferase n=1 Tax=Marinitoga piezophila (strain DSM 14283 / JCM 11233 / KA3) TaxID=443254 RepID=H2J508_MARPK|nr:MULTISPECIES: protein-glutamate O-methyltransferase CheR [Marinitoga]AEX86025.1 methylase of chemotaxis methyl-accepting protein [Marinitoga piezophila KA3]APT76449.1 chemotaxis protein CheR [Marinitoga sp. 1137]NUU96211.1 chemotaxis protein CheR [Marinitoga sp. 1135]NUU98134.1 chemotaxis protein CheR [Marinitoga sp. 1138]
MNEKSLYTSPYDDNEYKWLLDNIAKHFELDLRGYKQHRVRRRIDMIMRKYSYKDYKTYFNDLKKDPKKWDEFLDKLTINVTEFFRNPEKWEYLKKNVLPRLMKESGSKTKLWSAGCSTGEEPYTLSIILEELKAPKTIKVMATDLDKFVIAKAKRGVYSSRSLVNISEDLKNKYFKKVGPDSYEVSPIIKSRVVFKQHNLLMDPFEKNLDLIVCRNVVIYFDMEAKNGLYKNFAASLRKGGVLFVGSTERIFNYRSLGLEVIEPFFYQKVSD